MEWSSSSDRGKDDEPLVVNAAAAFRNKPVAVHTTRGDLRALVRRLRAETRERLVSLSNEKFRTCVASDPASGGEAMESFCGAVLVFYCTRHVLEGRPVPLASSSSDRNTTSRLAGGASDPSSSVKAGSLSS